MTKSVITISIDDEILTEFDSEYENRSKKIEELMDKATFGTSRKEELKRKRKALKQKIDENQHQVEILEKRLQNIESQEDVDQILENFFSNEAEKFERGHPQKYSDFEDFWNKFGTGIRKKFENKGFDLDSHDLKDEIKKRT